MNIAVTKQRYTPEDLLAMPDSVNYELVNGELVERNVGEYFHGMLQGLIVELLNSRRRKRGFRVFPETRVRVSDEPRYRIPDISVKALPHEFSRILTRPDLVIEILSPGR